MKKTLGPPPVQTLNGGGEDGEAEPPTRPISLPELGARREAAIDGGLPPLSLHDTWAAIVAIDEDCRICAFNREAERITGLQAPEVLGRRFCQALWSLGCSASSEHSGCPWQYAIQGRERRKHPREIMARIGERRIDVLLGARTTLTEQGTTGALITFVHLSQRREIERVRNEL